MKHLILSATLVSFTFFSAYSQCNFDTVDVDDFEYSTAIVGLQSGTVYHYSPMSLKPAHSPTRYCYMNFVNGLSANTLVFNRTYNVCPGNEYRFSAWFSEINGGSTSYTLQVKDANGSSLVSSAQSNSTNSWVKWTSASFTPVTSTVQFQLVYTGGTGNNDLAMDDVMLEVCEIAPVQSDSISVCNRTMPFNLLDSISLPYGSSGTWSGPSALGNGSAGTFDANSMLAGEYTYTLQNNGCPDSIGTIYVAVQTVDTAVMLNNGVLTASAANAGYQWIDCNNNQALTGETSQSFTPTANGSYAVEITEDGCVDTSACVSISNIGIDENAFPGLVLSPNPTSGMVRISLGAEFDNVKVTVYNTLGQALQTTTADRSGELKIDLSPFEADIYLLHVSADQQQRTVKVILE